MFSHDNELKMEEVSFLSAMQVIKEGKGLVKTICSPVGNNSSWEEFLPKLVKAKMDERNELVFTDITSTSLMPLNGFMQLFEPAKPEYKDTVGLLFDLSLSSVQFVFETNAFSKNWLNIKNAKIPPQITLNKLSELLKKATLENILSFNEVLAGVTWESLTGVFATSDTPFFRLNALAKQHLVKKYLGKIIPVFIHQSNLGIIPYNFQLQVKDIQEALKLDENNPNFVLVKNEIDPSFVHEVVSHSSELEEKLITIVDNVNEMPLNFSFVNAPSNFISDVAVPVELKYIVLDYLDLYELAEYKNQVPVGKKDKNIYKFLMSNFQEREKDNLVFLANKINLSVYDSDFFSRVFRVIIEEIYSFSVISKAVVAMHRFEIHDVTLQFLNYINSAKFNLNIILLFLKSAPKLLINYYQKLVIDFSPECFCGWECTCLPSARKNIDNWSMLVTLVLLNDLRITRLVINKFPEQVSHILSTLSELKNLEKKYYGCAYKPQQIVDAESMIHYELKDQHNYKFNNQLKWRLEAGVNTLLEKSTSSNAILQHYNQLSGTLFFNQRRNAVVDKIRQQPFSSTKKRLLSTMQQKLTTLPQTHQASQGLEQEALNIKKAELQTILKSHQSKLLHEHRGAIFFLFYSVKRTLEKLKAIGEAIAKVEKIQNLAELRLFADSLILNKDLIQRRSIGLLESNMFNALDDYNEKFMQVKF